MPHESRDLAYMWDMLDAAQAIAGFVAGQTFEQYMSNRMLRGAVERHIEIIGEAARRISEETQLSAPTIPWRQIIGQRNILAHEYDEIHHEGIWKVATGRIPELIIELRKLLPKPEENPNV